MLEFTLQVLETDNELSKIMNSVRELKKYEALVGIPDEANGRPDDGSVTNAELLFIHTNGSPINGIPPRPVVEPAIEAEADSIGDLLQKAADEALEGRQDGIRPALEKAGMHGQNVVRKWFTDDANGWPPNKQATIDAKGSSRPLIDTGELRKAITYKVERK